MRAAVCTPPRVLMALGLALVYLVGLAPGANGSSSVTLYSMTTDGAWKAAAGTQWLAQSFSTGASPVVLTSVGVEVRNATESNSSSTPSTLTFKLYESTTSAPIQPTGAPLVTLKEEALGAWASGRVTATDSYTLSSNTRYFVVVTGSSGGTIGWKYNTAAPTSGITPTPTFYALTSTDGGAAWSSFGSDNFNMIVSAEEATPSSPTAVTATADNGSASVSWSAPTSTGSSAIIDYTVTSSPESRTCTTSATSCTVTGLTNGSSYTFTVVARNSSGTGPASSSSSAITPRTVPDAPASVSASAGDATATVSWSVPLSDGGSAITGYTATSSPGGLTCTTSSTSCTISGLTNGTGYTFSVVATNVAGNSVASAASSVVTPQASGGGGGGTPEPTRTPNPSMSASPTPSPSPSLTASPTASPTVASSPTSMRTPRPERTSAPPDERVTSETPLAESSEPTEPATTEEEVEALVEEEVVEESPSPTVEETSEPESSPQRDVESAPVAVFDAQPPPGQSLLTDDALVGPVMNLRVDLQIGASVEGRSAIVEAAGLQPGSSVQVLLYSDPQVIGTGVADAAGNAAIATQIPGGLPPGQHTVMAVGTGPNGNPVQSVGAFEITADQVATAFVEAGQVAQPIDPDDPQLTRALAAGKPLFDVALYPAVIATVAITGAAVAALAGMGGLSGTGSAPGSGSSERSSRGKLAGVVTKKLKALGAKDEGPGDRSRTWAMPGTRRTDAWIKELPKRAGRFSALLPRVLVDGAWSRAMFGSFGFVLWGIGLALGLWSAWSTGFQALPPALPLMLAIIALGILDAAAGAIAWLTIVVGALVTGNLTTWPEFRTALGLFVIFASIPLLAHVIRPLRRRVGDSWMDRFDRIADYVMPPIFLAFAAASMFKALNGLSGLELVSSEDFGEVRVVVVVAFLIRMAMEDVATYAYPVRSAEVQPEKLVSPGKGLSLLSVAIRVGLFLIIAEPFFGLGWATYLSALLIAIPLVLKVYEDDLPNVVWLNKWYPRGVANFAMLLVVGIYVSFWLLGQDATDEQVRQTYNLILLPGIVSGLIQLVGREGGVWPDAWWKRALGFVVWLFAVGIVTGVIALV